jgi:tetratricopeptide (TPR) repeat protein
LARAEIEVAFDTSISRCTGVLERAEAGTAADVTLAVDDDEIRANLAGLASVTFHVPSEVYSSENGPKELAAETLSCAAVALARAGHGDPAARVAVEFFAESVFVAVPPLAAELAAAMAQAGRVVEVVEIAERLDQDTQDARRAAGAVFMTITRERTHALRPHEHQTFEAALRARLNRRLRAGESKEAAAAAENLGVYLTQARRPWDAIEPLEQCMALEPRRQSAGLVAHLAGAYFLSGRWSDSVLAYEQALDLAHERDPWLETRRADALLYAGRYREALQAFRQHVESEDLELAAWAYSKARAIEWIVKTTGIEMQDPDPDAANQLAARWPEVDSPEGQDQLASDVWRRDAASSLGWFNRARDLLDRGRESEAMHAYLTAAVMREGDVEAWVNVALLAVNTRDDDLFFASVLTGHRLNPESYMNEFSRQLRATSEDLAFRDEILQGVREVTRTTDEDNGAVVSNVR